MRGNQDALACTACILSKVIRAVFRKSILRARVTDVSSPIAILIRLVLVLCFRAVIQKIRYPVPICIRHPTARSSSIEGTSIRS